MTQKKRTGSLTNRYKKQHGLHHKHNGKYIKVYWPYLPVFAIVITGIIASIVILIDKPDTPIASSNMPISSLLASANQARQSSHLQPLQVNSQLTQAAQIKANDMAVNDYWSPVSPSGTTPWQIIKSTGYPLKVAGENLAYGFSSADKLSSAWLNSQSHKQNILNSNYSDVGFGIAVTPDFQGQGPETIVVALYGSTSAPVSSNQTNGQTFTSASINQPNNQTIARFESFTSNNATLSLFISGLIIGTIGCYLIIKHGLIIKKWLSEGEEVIIKHPFLDIALVVMIIAVAGINQTIGFIR
jgi:hypothetical protein